MAKLLFWNLHKQNNPDVISQVVATQEADIVALAEASHLQVNDQQDKRLQRSLRVHTRRTFRRLGLGFTVSVYTALPDGHVKIISDRNPQLFLSLRQLSAPDLLISFMHLPSKMATDIGNLSMLATRLRVDIEWAEAQVRHERTIIMGDLNMDPHELGVISSESFHATMCMEIARRRQRTVHGQKRRFFYNPMWNFLGDRTKGPPGTFYRQTSHSNAQFWHMPDQVLLRPEAIDLVDLDSLEIVTKTPALKLAMPDGRPNIEYSDHFPICLATRDLKSQELP